MRILLLSQWFDPEPMFKGLLFARGLVARGHEVDVLTGFPNYPGGNIYPGYRIRPWVREQIDGISILRVALYPSHDKSGFRRTLNYMSFAISAALIGTALIRQPDVVYVYHPPATIGLVAAVIGFFRKVPFIYDIQDLWPDTVSATGMLKSRIVIMLLNRCCRFVYRRANRIVVLSPGFKRILVERGVPAAKIEVIYNWCDEASLRHTPSPTQIGAPGEFTVLFAGTMGISQALDAVLEAARLCRQAVPQARFVFIGGGVDRERLEHKAKTMELGNIRFLPYRPMREMGSILAAADVLLVHLKDDPLFRITIPSKTQAYLAVGKPILMGVRGDAADIVQRSGCGLACEPENPESIAAVISQLAALDPKQRSEMGRNGARYYAEHMAFDLGVGRFEQAFAAAIEHRS